MHVRPHREGVAQSFVPDKAAAMMASLPPPPPQPCRSTLSHDCKDDQSAACNEDATLRYSLRPDSRSAYFQPTQASGTAEDACNAAFVALAEELVRREVFDHLITHELLPRLQRTAENEMSSTEDKNGSAGTSNATERYWLTRQELCELPARWVIQSINQIDCVTAHRTSVTPLDIGATVRLLSSSAPSATTTTAQHVCTAQNAAHCVQEDDAALYRVVATAEMCNGAYWVDIAPLTLCTTPSDRTRVQRVMREAVVLQPAAEVHPDPLLPCDELYSVRGTSTCLYSTLLAAMQRTRLSEQTNVTTRKTRTKRERSNYYTKDINTSAEDMREATRIVREMAQATLRHRRLLAARCAALRANMQLNTSPNAKTGESVWLRLRYDGKDTVQFRLPRSVDTASEKAAHGESNGEEIERCLEMLPRALQKLAAMWDARVRHLTECASRARSTAVHSETEGTERASKEENGEDDARTRSAWAAVAWLLASRSKNEEEEGRYDEDDDGWYVIRGDVSHADNTARTSSAITFCPQPAFFLRVATLLVRYGSIYGTAGYNQGPHAALPPPLMHRLSRDFRIAAEGFASPLNAQLMRYHSLFIDTDAYFGSMGSFMDVYEYVCETKAHLEVNPPFDKAVIARMEQHILHALRVSDETKDGTKEAKRGSLLYLVVLPSHDAMDEAGRAGSEGVADLMTAGKCTRSPATGTAGSTERTLCTSKYCLGHVLCAAHEAAYVDGHQHLLRAPLFCITTPTRLIVLGNDMARRQYGDAQARLEGVRCAWRDMTADSRV